MCQRYQHCMWVVFETTYLSRLHKLSAHEQRRQGYRGQHLEPGADATAVFVKLHLVPFASLVNDNDAMVDVLLRWEALVNRRFELLSVFWELEKKAQCVADAGGLMWLDGGRRVDEPR